MQFSVIHQVVSNDCVNIHWYKPESGEWTQTEGDEQFSTPEQYPDPILYPEWQSGHHRKWCANLSEEEFLLLIEEAGLTYQGEGTALGAIGCGFSNALVFENDDDYDVKFLTYVTPHCPQEEIAEWLRNHNQSVPVALTDDPKQTYLFGKKAMDRRTAWEAVASCIADIV